MRTLDDYEGSIEDLLKLLEDIKSKHGNLNIKFDAGYNNVQVVTVKGTPSRVYFQGRMVDKLEKDAFNWGREHPSTKPTKWPKEYQPYAKTVVKGQKYQEDLEFELGSLI